MRNTVFCLSLTALCLVSNPSIAAAAPEMRRSASSDTARVQVAQAPKGKPAPVASSLDTARKAAAPAVVPPATLEAAPAADSLARSDTAKAAAASAAPAASASPAGVASQPTPPSDSVILDSARTIPAPAASMDTATASEAAAAPAPDSGKAQAGKSKKRKRIVRETTVNTIDELKGRYRSPKKALFMSLIVPGMGQAYVGQHWANYVRGAAYLLTDVGLALGWRHYVVTKQDRQIRRYRAFADSNWRQSKYEDSISQYDEQGKFEARFPHRETYCQSVQGQETATGIRLYKGCVSPEGEATAYDEFRNQYRDADWEKDSISQRRSEFPNAHNFYELIGKEVEFVTGWLDADDISITDSSFTQVRDGKVISATTDLQQEYIRMRAKANDYARMQAYFLGGIVLNHIVSALDAAFAAHFHNKSLYQTEVGFWERLQLDSYVAWDGNAPRPTISASLTF